jgi:hypothetical protein
MSIEESWNEERRRYYTCIACLGLSCFFFRVSVFGKCLADGQYRGFKWGLVFSSFLIFHPSFEASLDSVKRIIMNAFLHTAQTLIQSGVNFREATRVLIGLCCKCSFFTSGSVPRTS